MNNLTDFLRRVFGGGQGPLPASANAPKKNPKQPDGGDLYKKGDLIGGEYEVHGTLGKGGFGIVYLVSDRQTGRVYALKTFRDELLADQNAREAFRKEALLWVNLGEHPCILEAQWVRTFSGRLFVAMDYVPADQEGRVTLYDHLRCGAPFPADRSVEWAIQFCLGMEHANAHGVKCHRDIKPSNILIAQGALKISDFGLAAASEVAWKATASQRDSLVTGDATDGFGFSVLRTDGKIRCGTPGYMAPEVYRGESADTRSDIYSFGLVLWQIATGSALPPFVSTHHRNIEAYMHEAYEQQITGRVPVVSSQLRSVIERCLNPAPAKRYSTFGEVRNRLESLYHTLTGKEVTLPAVGDQTAAFWNNKGMSLASLGRQDEAIVCYDKALAIDPREAKIWTNKGVTLATLHRHEEALFCHDKALELAPELDGMWSNKGGALDALGRYEEAIVCYDQALRINPHSSGTWNNKGSALNTLERHAEAIACFDEALTIDSRYAEAWNGRAAALAALGRHEEEMACYDKALAIDPRSGTAWYNKGRTLASLGRREKAIHCYDEALAIDPRNAAAWYNKGNALDALERREDAIACYDKALAIEPRNDMIWNNKGGSLDVLGRYEEAVACYDNAMALNPQKVETWFNKAFAEDAIGRTVSAVRSYRKFLELAPAQYAKQIAHARKRIGELSKQ